MIKCESVSMEYIEGGSFLAVKEVSLHIARGEFVSITGKSGSGKSTLLKIIGLIETPSSGKVWIDGLNVSDMNENEKADVRNKKIGYVFQSYFLEPDYSVLKNVEMPMIIAGISGKIRRTKAEHCLEMVGLLEKKEIRAGKLSGGEKQRVSIARALVMNPEIILADEPCGNLDSENSQNIMDIFLRLNGLGKTIVLITHNSEESNMSSRKIKLKDGEIVT